MNLKGKLAENWRAGALGALSSVLLGYFFLTGPWQGLTYRSYDLPFIARPVQPVDEAVIVYMDELAVLNYTNLLQRCLGTNATPDLWTPLQGPWHRALHAELVRELKRQSARAIVFDVLWDQSWLDSLKGLESPAPFDYEVDRLLADAIRATSNVVLAADLRIEYDAQNRPVRADPILPLKILREATPQWGVIQMPQEPDGVIRRHYNSPIYTNLAWAVAQAIGKAPADPARERWLSFYGPPGRAIPSASYFEVFEPGALPVTFFSNKVVFVGKGKWIKFSGSRDTKDEFPSPYGRDIPGVELQATAFLNLVGQDWLQQLARPSQLLLIVGFGTLLGFGLVLVRPWVAFRLAVAALAIFMGFTFYLLWQIQTWFPWMIPAAVQIPVALGWAVVANSKKLYREKAALEQTLATARSGVHADTQRTVVLPLEQPPTLRLPPQPPGVPSVYAPGSVSVSPPGAPAISDLNLLRLIGQGSYGEVWLAQDVIRTYKAVKVVYRRSFNSANPFDREFRGLQKFTPISRSHPGFVNILHVGRNEELGYFYAIMELGDDERTGQQIDPDSYSPKNLARELKRRGHLTVGECVELGIDLADALHYLHQQKLIHRDIKPSNIIFVKDQPKFADIGLVTDIGVNAGDATYLGTEGFIAPEGPGTAGADVYSLGKLLYEAGMGRDREKFPELPTTLAERPDPRALMELNDIILKACEADPRHRYQTAAEFRADLVRLKETLG